MSSSSRPAGTLSVVSTPIGNLEDVTLRALRVLREADLIAAEDTRHTAKLLHHYGISTPTLSLHEHNEWRRTPDVLARLEAGEHVALVTDAGTPILSDPGLHLVRATLDRGFRVVPIPGPSAVMAAVAGSGAVSDRFTFLGFSPRKKSERRAWLERLRDEEGALVMFEAPHRVVSMLEDVLDILGDRELIVCRELTKVHEEFVRTTVAGAVAALGSKDKIGELTLVFPARTTTDELPITLSDVDTWHEICRMTESGQGRRDAVATLARRLGKSVRDTYSAAERGKLQTVED
jgi:16S rRNA (cytidine1402-2'-O)-methyltransferase